MEATKTALYYLNKRFVNEKFAGESVFEQGGHRLDAEPHEVLLRNGRLIDDGLMVHEKIEHYGFALGKIDDGIYGSMRAIDMQKIEHDKDLQLKYFRAIEKVVMGATKCDYVRAFNFVIRESNIIGVHTKPVGDNSARGPVNDVHTDFTPSAPAITSITELSRSIGLGGCRFSILNCWRSVDLENPVLHWPMAVCDVKSINHAEDLVPRISPENGNHIYNVLPNKKHKWYTFPLQTAQEILLFKQYDTIDTLRCYTPHTAFNDPRSPENAPSRRSCEVRCICWYDNEGEFTESLKVLDQNGVGLVSDSVKERFGSRSKL